MIQKAVLEEEVVERKTNIKFGGHQCSLVILQVEGVGNLGEMPNIVFNAEGYRVWFMVPSKGVL